MLPPGQASYPLGSALAKLPHLLASAADLGVRLILVHVPVHELPITGANTPGVSPPVPSHAQVAAEAVDRQQIPPPQAMKSLHNPAVHKIRARPAQRS